MTPRLTIAITAGLVALAAPAHAADALFSTEAPIEVRIEAPIKTIVRKAKRSTQPHSATLSSGGVAHAITLAARGKSRRTRGYCRFPPLRVRFAKRPKSPSPFAGETSLKLVTHCRDADASRDAMQMELAAYRIQSALSDRSLRVREARVSYVDAKSGKTETQPGFFIEDADHAAKRLSMRELDRADIPLSALDPQAAVRASVFHYLIGNTDFALAAPAPGSDCCHNTKLLGASKRATTAIMPVAYDFDNSGLVDASYAEPNESLKIRSVTTRVWRGHCRYNARVPAEAARVASRRAELLAIIDRSAASDARKAKARAYLSEGLDTLGNPAAVQSKLIGACR